MRKYVLLSVVVAAVGVANGLILPARLRTSGGGNGLNHQVRQATTKCTSSNLLSIVQDALDYYSGTDNAQGIASRITNNVVAAYSGPWISIVTQLNGADVPWAFWGSNSIFSSSNFCLVTTDTWLVQIIKADLS